MALPSGMKGGLDSFICFKVKGVLFICVWHSAFSCHEPAYKSRFYARFSTSAFINKAVLHFGIVGSERIGV